MSVNPNQSWITASNALFGTGSGNTFNQVIANQVISATNATYETRYDLSGTGITNAVNLGKYVIGYDASASGPRAEIIPTSGGQIGFFGNSAGSYWAVGNNNPANIGVALNTFSSMTGTSAQPGVLDLNGLISTLKVVYPPIVK